MKKTLVLLASVAFALIMFSSCNFEPKPLTSGQWKNARNEAFQFNDDKTGKEIQYPFAGGEESSTDFTYEIIGTDSIKINFSKFDAPQTYFYQINGSELKIKGGDDYQIDMSYSWEERK